MPQWFLWYNMPVMSLEHELINLDEKLAKPVVNLVWKEAEEQPQPDEDRMLYLEDKYEVFNSIIDELAERWDEEVFANQLAPEIANAMSVGARVLGLVMMNMAESEILYDLFKAKPDTE